VHKQLLLTRACLDQLLIAIRSFTLLCDHNPSNCMPCRPLHNHAGLSECQLSLPPHCEGEEGISESVAAAAGALGLCKVLCSLPLTACRNTPFLPSSVRQSYTLCCTLAYKVPPDDACWHKPTLRRFPQPASPPCTRRPTDGDRPSTLVSRCQHSGLLTYVTSWLTAKKQLQ